MTDKLDTIMGKITPLIRMLASDVDGETLNAARVLKRTLANQGVDFNDLAHRIEHGSPLERDEMQKLLNSGYEQGFAAGTEYGKNSAILAGAQPIGIFSASVDDGVNGYSWAQIAAYCAMHKDRFHGKPLEFVTSLPEKLARYGAPTSKQADFLRDLFMQKFGGRID